MVKGGFRVYANLTGGAVVSPFRLRSVAGAVATVVNPWPGRNVSVHVVAGGGAPVPVAVGGWKKTPGGEAFVFRTMAGEEREYIVTASAGLSPESTEPRRDDQEVVADVRGFVTCTMFNGNCSACIAASDMRKAWASKCLYLSGGTEGGATCQPSKWWFPPYDSAKLYPKVHACANCTTPASAYAQKRPAVACL